MKLYYSPGACSLAPHIALRESGLVFDLVMASTKTHTLQDGTDYYAINPKGCVPLLELENGERLSEGPAILQYIADQVPAKNLAPACGTMARYRLQEWLNFITSEVHKGFGALFNPATPADYKAMAATKLLTRLTWVNGQLEGKQHLMGDTFTVADAYLFTTASWTKPTALDISALTHLTGYLDRVVQRPAVLASLKAEGLIK